MENGTRFDEEARPVGIGPVVEGRPHSSDLVERLPRKQARTSAGYLQRYLEVLNTEPRGHFYQISERIRLHFLHHLTTMCFYSALTDAELATGLLVQ